MQRSVPVSREARVTSAMSDLQSQYIASTIASKTTDLSSARESVALCKLPQAYVNAVVFSVAKEFRAQL